MKSVCRLVRWSVWCSAEHLDMTGSDRRADKLHNSEIHNLYSSLHTSWWVVWKMWHSWKAFFFFYLGSVCSSSGFKHRSLVAYCAIQERHTDISTKFLLGDLNTRAHYRRIYICGKIILIWIFNNWVGRYGLDSSYSQQGLAVSSCGDSNYILDQMSDY
jgi:hypothetical protein